MQNYKMKKISGEDAKKILESMVAALVHIEPEYLTTFEKNVLKVCVENPPSGRGVETKILDN